MTPHDTRSSQAECDSPTQLELFVSASSVDIDPPSFLRADLVGNLNSPEPLPEDKRLTGERHAQALLMWIHRFGWLSSRMVAALIFPTASQSWPLARRLLKKLLGDKLILVRALPQGGDVYLLSVKGARLLNEAMGAKATSGQGQTITSPLHRACGNWHLISQVQAGLHIFTEHEIASGRAPFRTLNGKQFDGLVIHDGGLITAIEIENSWKNRSRRQAVCDIATHHLGRDTMTRLGVDASGNELHLARMTIVATSMDALRSMAATFQESYRNRTASESCLASVDVCVLPVSPSLVPGESVAGNLWWTVMQPLSVY